MIRLLIADDHEMLLDGLSSALARAPDITLAGRASDGLLALHLLRDERPDVALLDVHMPVRTGMDVLRAARHEGLPTRIVLMTSFDDDPTYREALALGAHGFLGKSAGVQRVLAAVRAVARGETSFESGIGERARRAQRPSSGEPPPRPPPRENPLTPREREILRLIATGLSNREIAEHLGTSEGTVKNQTSSILMKLEVRDRTRAVLIALRDGWI